MYNIKADYKINTNKLYIMIWLMVSLYPLLVVPGSLPYFYGPRYIFLAILSLITAALLFLKQLKLNQSVYRQLLIFLLFALVSTLLSADILNAWGGSDIRFTGLSTYIFCAVMFVAASKINDSGKILKAMVIVAALVSVTAILQHFGINIVPHEAFREHFHSYGTLGNPNFLGTYTVFIMPASIMLYFNEKHIRWLIVSALIFAALLTSMTRGAWLAFAVIFMIIVYYVWKNPQLKNYLFKLAIVLLAVFFFISFTNNQLVFKRSATVSSEIEAALELDDSAGSNRVLIWKETLKRIPQAWAFGVGPDSLRIPMAQNYSEDKAFNIFLEIAATMGLFALIAYLVFLYYCLRERRRDWLGTTFAFMVLAYLLQGQFNIDVIMNLPLFWITLGLMQSKTAIDLRIISETSPKDAVIDGKRKKMVNEKRVIILMVTGIAIFIIFIALMFLFPRQGSIEVEGQGVYTGQLRGSTFHGYGTWEATNGVVYQGDFKHGYFDGYGTMTFINGSQYSGEFKEGYFHGQGHLITADGQIIEGTWENGNRIDP